MPSDILVNNLGLTYKSSVGISTATLPDVCKTPTPGGPVPVPYPNFANQGSLDKGTKTVKAHGNMIAIKGSEYSMSFGDEPGTVGGVTSNTFKKETAWITYSFDVKMDGENACRHTDKKFHNHKNTVDLAGNIDPAVALNIDQAIGLLCTILCECKAGAQATKFETLVDPMAFDEPDFGVDPGQSPGKAANQACVEQKFNKDYKNTNLRAEQAYDMSARPHSSPVPGRPPGSKIPDFVHLIDPAGPAQAPNINVIEMKFPPDKPGRKESRDYKKIGGGKQPIILDPDTCDC